MAKAWVSERFKQVATLAHEIYGAVAFTEDYDLYLYFKRAKAWEMSLGDSNFHLNRIR
jgi:alkylation response protein AidB-like acyl-CoA dehydrogenase